MTLNKMHGLGLIFTMLVVILIVSPSTINNMYNNILGRVGLIALIIFFAMHNVTLGLLVALCVIIASNMHMVEGFDTASIGTGQNIDPSLLGTGDNISNIKQELQTAQANQSANASSTSTSSPATTPTTITTTPSTTSSSTTSSTSAPSTTTTSTTTPSTTPSTTTTTSTTTTATTNKKDGVDRQAVQQALQSTSSNSMPVNRGMFKSDEVAPSTAPSTTTQEGFSSMGAPY